jgi:uncharacterized protein
MRLTGCGLECLAVIVGFAWWGPVARADELADGPSKVKVESVVPLQARAFQLEDVRLLEGPFQHAMELDRQYLLSLDADRLLHNFRVNAGLPSSAQPLGGWEEPKGELRGHFVGHYLTACALMYASTGDQQIKAKGNAVVAGLAECQAKIGTGYLSAYPEEFLDRVESLRRVWAPYYTLHKIYAGLLDMYIYCDNQQALDVCKKFADWVIARNAKLSDEQMQKMLGTEHGGMNEALANLYGLTGEKKYLTIAQRFNHMAVLGPASNRQDKLTGLHANTQIPKFVGAAREYELTGQDWLKTASLFFWDTVVKERSYVIGGHSDGEGFSPKEKLSEAFGPSTTETCNTYNMLKLTRHLFCWDPKAEYADYYERALYNHILCSQHPETGMMCYYVPLRSGSHKEYNTPLDSFWCCTGTGVENHAKYGDSIYFHNDSTLWVNLFIASELNWKAKGLNVRQETRYPDEATSRLVLTADKPVELSVKIRRPYWAVSGFEIRVNGDRSTDASTPGSFVTISRTWKSGDKIEIAMPFTTRTEGFKDNPHRFAFLDGPLVLSAEVDAATPLPAVLTDGGQALRSLKPISGRPSVFTGSFDVFRVIGQESDRQIMFEPFYKMHGERRYVVYWDQLTPTQWQTRQDEYKAELARAKELDARAVDRVNLADRGGERQHGLRGEKMETGEFSNHPWRHATEGGWFSYNLKVLPDQPQELLVTYWGSDAGGRAFDILIDGRKLATEKLESNRPGQFYDQAYPLPKELTSGKTTVTVKFQAHPGQMAGGVYGCAIVKAKN